MGHSYAVLLKTKGYATGLTSKKPIEVKEKSFKEIWYGLLHCKTNNIDFFVVHLSPMDCDVRMKEAKKIVERTEDQKPENYIIVGDFNAHSLLDGELLKADTALSNHYKRQKSGNIA